MKPFSSGRHFARHLRRDTFIFLMPILLTVVAILWFLREDLAATLKYVLVPLFSRSS